MSSTVYDLAGRTLAQVNELGYATTTLYDLAGRQTGRWDALNRIVSYTLDSVGNTLGIAYTGGALVTFAVDPLNRRTTMIDWGCAFSRKRTPLSEISGQGWRFKADTVGGNRRTLFASKMATSSAMVSVFFSKLSSSGRGYRHSLEYP